jgi:hypothetical protein
MRLEFQDRSSRKDWRFPVKLSKDGPENSKRIVGHGRAGPRRDAAEPRTRPRPRREGSCLGATLSSYTVILHGH